MVGTGQILSEEDILSRQDWHFPLPIAYGPGRLPRLACNARGLAFARRLW